MQKDDRETRPYKFLSKAVLAVTGLIALAGIAFEITKTVTWEHQVPPAPRSLTLPAAWLPTIQQGAGAYHEATALSTTVRAPGPELDNIKEQLNSNIGPALGWYIFRADETTTVVVIPLEDRPLLTELEKDPVSFINHRLEIQPRTEEPQEVLVSKIEYQHLCTPLQTAGSMAAFLGSFAFAGTLGFLVYTSVPDYKRREPATEPNR